jgi:hypothetical protein
VITRDYGGNANQYASQLGYLNRNHRKVEIRGICESGCALALGAENVCVGKKASVGFHYAYDERKGKVLPQFTDEFYSKIPEHIYSEVRPYLRKDVWSMSRLNYHQLVNLGIPACGDRGAF